MALQKITQPAGSLSRQRRNTMSTAKYMRLRRYIKVQRENRPAYVDGRLEDRQVVRAEEVRR